MHTIWGVHTIMIIAGGLALLAICLLMGWRVSRGDRTAGFARAARLFLPGWFLAAAINMAFGVSRGHTFAQELPTFLVVFTIPAATAVLIWWRVSLR